MRLVRQPAPRRLGGIDGQPGLRLPVEFLPGARHLEVPLGGAGDALGDIAGVRRDARGDDAEVHVLGARQAQVLRGGDVAQEVDAGGRRYGAPYRGRDVIVAGSDVRNEGPQRVEGRAAADLLLEADVFRHRVEGHVARALEHHLGAGAAGALGQLGQRQQLANLGAVVGVREASGPQAVAQREREVVRDGEFNQTVEEFVVGVFGLVARHPAGHKRAAAGDDVQLAALGLEPVHGVARDAGVQRHERDAVLGVFLNDVEQFVYRNVGEVLAGVLGVGCYLVNGDGSQRERRLRQNRFPHSVEVAAGREVHQRVGAGVLCHAGLAELQLDVGAVAARADVGVDLGPKALADSHGPDALAEAIVEGNYRGAFRDEFPECLGRNALRRGGPFHFRSYAALYGRLKLRHRQIISVYIILLKNCIKVKTARVNGAREWMRGRGCRAGGIGLD